ncbi:MAG: DUF2461 domain-containing protein [Ferruginibacter sp.]
MLQRSTITFLKELHHNNNRPWFEANRSSYDNAKEDFQCLVEQLIREIGKFDENIATLEVKNCVFRQYRDVRFSKNKRPYKNNMGAYFNLGGRKINTAGYYIHIEPGRSFVAGGLYDPESSLLAKLRQEIDYNLDDWKRILNNRSFKKNFPSGLNKDNMISRPPKGYDIENPAIDYLKLKSFTVSTLIPDNALFQLTLKAYLPGCFKSLKPMLDFLNHALA